LRTTVASALIGDIILSLRISFLARAAASLGSFFFASAASSSWISLLNSSRSPSSFWIARICSLR